MDSVSIHRVLALYTWLGVSILIGWMALIARFYERLSGERTRYRWFLVPVLSFGGAAARRFMLDRAVGDPATNVLLATGGVTLGLVCWRMYRLMTSGH